jgi:hypothetical protein
LLTEAFSFSSSVGSGSFFPKREIIECLQGRQCNTKL